MTLPDELFDKFARLIYEKTGLHYELNKKYYVQKRLEKRAESLEMDNLNEYYMMLRFADDESELEMLVNELTVNETYFFRDFPQLRNFAEDVLPVFMREKGDRKKIKIWSAACSTGEEPYTLSIILLEMLDEPEEWEIQILASDINTEVLQKARAGLYEGRSVRDVPPEYLEKYFTKRDDKYLINLNVKKPVIDFDAGSSNTIMAEPHGGTAMDLMKITQVTDKYIYPNIGDIPHDRYNKLT